MDRDHGSWNLNITSLRTNNKRAMYVCKYIGKDLAAFAHCKRWWRSHDYNEKEELTDEQKRERAQWDRDWETM